MVPIGSKDKGCERSILYLQYSLHVLSLLGLLMISENSGDWLFILALGVDMRKTYIKECWLHPLISYPDGTHLLYLLISNP